METILLAIPEKVESTGSAGSLFIASVHHDRCGAQRSENIHNISLTIKVGYRDDVNGSCHNDVQDSLVPTSG